MQKDLLSINRMINKKNPGLKEPQMSVVAVNLRREELENIRKKKGIPVRVFEKKINLSKSRYYRWLQYQVDLPMEMIIGLKKVLNISDIELLQLVVSSTDEQLQLLTLLIYTSLSDEQAEFAQFIQIKNKLEKYRKIGDDNTPYFLMLTYADLVINSLQEESAAVSLEKIESYFLSIDFLTIFDILLYLGTLKIKQKFDLPESSMEKEMLLLEHETLRKLACEYNDESISILIGCVVDITMFYSVISPENAKPLIIKAIEILADNYRLDSYTENILVFLDNLLNEEHRDEAFIATFRKNFEESRWCLPKCETDFFGDLIKEEEYFFEKMVNPHH
ncbi:helix-turn-helix transcriptional regulator [Enterococcus sp. ALS3]|uniref:Helix-turn-helix transcriptional regulator n=1 Tax=Enterococcus alishanensis TaxID=1303817 RepID=A0ABS6TDY9_9ENTE|nr:helix-turn-helix transcriptional regulator [Enterococcus alishanensis]MBV7391109.1 helix-turn-helix transcriptional regulator [Enterococcus alishanensis]